MIHDVDETIRALVRRDVLNGSNVEISFEGPTKEWSAKQQGPTLNFYLYDIREDLNRRLVEYVEKRGPNGIVTDRRQPPRRYKLSYLVTAWTQRPEDEHRLLSAVLGAFIRSDILPEEILQGGLGGEPDPVKVTIALPPPQDRSISDVWSALGGELKPSLDLVITAPFSTERTREVGPLVTEEPRFTFQGPDGDGEELGKARRASGSGSSVASAMPASDGALRGSGDEAVEGGEQEPPDDAGARRDSANTERASWPTSAEPTNPQRRSSEEGISEEVILGGKPGSGRMVRIRQLPRS